MSDGESMSGSTTGPGGVRWTSHALSVAIAAAAAIYVSLFWVRAQLWMPRGFRDVIRQFHLFAGRQVTAATALVDWTPTGRWGWALVSLAMGLVLPWLVMVLIGRGRPRDLGLRWPNRIGWRLIAVGYIGSLPLLVLMASSAATRAYYEHEITHWSLGRLFGPYLIVLIAEHFLFHGVLLAALRPGRRWPTVPTPAPVDGGVVHRVARWIGLAQPTECARGLGRLGRWIGLPDVCWGALLLQTALFGLVHVGKSPAEVAMSFPGGLAMGYVAYRCNSWLVPMVLHAGTGLSVLVLIRWWPG